MKQSALPFLACPAAAGSGRCGGGLVHGPLPGLPSRTLESQSDELREGGLRCLTCRAEYPVLSGVAVLTPKPEEYFRRYYRAILRDLDRHGDLSSDARAWLARRCSGSREQDDYGADFRFSQQFEDPWSVARALADNPGETYGPFAGYLAEVTGRGPYDLLAAWSGELARERHLLLDAGCGGGGLLMRAAPHFALAMGVDFSFLAILLARRALLHLPEQERTYVMTRRRDQPVERPLNLPRLENAELVVGDCCALPCAPALFDAVCSSNVVDIAGIDAPLDEAARVLRPEGVLLLSDPFLFREGQAPPGEPRAALRTALESRRLRVEREQDGVPWAWATYDRHWRLYFNWCAAARK